ncbi:uncharacterized protein si:ch211-250c4.3 [Toxotes jaculatrix]|uniref:uncharacterized protein si:ch211-250c4.3 n=1 Tax=Toxotes jaculatrix TaxID=941984 RepID=UPI001B3A8A2C|nr:uncharacterized protein si:ch211-250c4.3 [Toxotes jaculatrix]
MSVKKKKAGLVISWPKSISILTPWRKGKGDRDAVWDGEVVLTKMKLFSNFHERLLMSADSASTISTVSVSEQDFSDLTKAPEVNFHLDDKSGQSQMETGSDYLPTIFSDSQLLRLYKLESEDSGVELPSGANSPSTPDGSEQSFIVHSRESSCNSCNLNTDPDTAPSDKITRHAVNSEVKQAEDSVDNSSNTTVNTQGNVFRADLHISEDLDRDQRRASESSPEADEDMSEQLGEKSAVAERTSSEDLRPEEQTTTGTCDDIMESGYEPEPIRRNATSDSLEEYMDECCRLSEAQQASSSPVSSGLGYLEHICQLIQKIGQLQETNLRLQRQICSLQKDSRMTKTKEDFFHQHCSCGAASLIFQDAQMRLSRSEFLSPSGAMDLSTIAEVTQHPLTSARRDMNSEGLTPAPLWRRGLNRRSYTEGEVCFLRGSTEGLSIPRRRLSENYTWGRVKDLVRKGRPRNQSKLGLTSSSLKMSCPQLYRPDLGPVEPAGRNRNSMIALGHQSKLDIPWLQ